MTLRSSQAILDSLKRAEPVCILCRGRSKHPPIVGDGPPRCLACIYKFGRLAAESCERGR